MTSLLDHRDPTRRPSTRRALTRVTALVTTLVVAAFAALSNAEDAAPGTPGAAPGTLRFVGHNLFGDANGVFHRWRVVEHRIDLANPASSHALVEVDLDSVDTGIADRDDHLRNPDFFETETYPVARARIHAFAPSANPAETERFDVSIDLDLHGVQKTVPGTIRLVASEDGTLVFEGETRIDRTDFGVGPPASRWNPMSPRAEIPIRFDVRLEGATAP